MAYPTLFSSVPNFPQPINRQSDNSGLVFPSDLVFSSGQVQRKFYTQIQFVEYKLFQQINSYGSYAMPSGGIKLPIPLKLNDNLVLHWSQVSLTETLLKGAQNVAALGGQAGAAAASGIGLAAQLGGAAVNGGLALNPLMFQLFQRPEYRQFSLSWVLTPRNEKESIAIKNIVTKCKKAASPDPVGGVLMTYPLVALIKMHPNDIFGHMIFKPCIINSVQVNYTGAPTPTFFKNGAPTVVTLTLNLTEMQFWFRKEIT